MKKIPFIILSLPALLFSSALLLAQEDGGQGDIPPGMERMRVGRGSEVVVPSGTRAHKVGDLVVLEKPEEYVARRMSEMDERLAKIEAENAALKARMERLEAQFIEAQKPALQSEQKDKR